MKTEGTSQEPVRGKVVESRVTKILDWCVSLIRDFGHLMGELGGGIVFGYILGAAAYVTCFVIAFKIPPHGEWWLNILLCLLGGAVGWFVGTLGSPMSGPEESKFAEYGKVLSALVTGFIAAKLDSLMGRFDTNPADLAILIGRVLLFTVPFFLCLQVPFIARWRVRPGTTEQHAKKRARRQRRIQSEHAA
jgi:hypothetical protein